MKEPKNDQMQIFKDLLQRVYEKGEKDDKLSTMDVLRDMEGDLRHLLSHK
ncbi:hypothetical protein [Bacillus tuaregi]|nr:hypothetical protein [Bacillus tuaregi]